MRLDRVGVLAFLVLGLFGGNVEAGQEGTDMKLEDMASSCGWRARPNRSSIATIAAKFLHRLICEIGVKTVPAWMLGGFNHFFASASKDSEHGRTRCWPAPVAIDPTRTSIRSVVGTLTLIAISATLPSRLFMVPRLGLT